MLEWSDGRAGTNFLPTRRTGMTTTAKLAFMPGLLLLLLATSDVAAQPSPTYSFRLDLQWAEALSRSEGGSRRIIAKNNVGYLRHSRQLRSTWPSGSQVVSFVTTTPNPLTDAFMREWLERHPSDW